MYMKAFLVALQQVVKKYYPDIEFGVYLSRRSKFAHMGLDVPLISINDHLRLTKFIQDYWEQNKEDDMFSFCTPRLIAATKFKFDYIIFQKKLFVAVRVIFVCFLVCSDYFLFYFIKDRILYFLEFKVPVEYVKEANFVSKPIYQTSGSVGSDLFSTAKYLLLPMKPTLVNCGLSVKIPRGYFGLISGRSSLALKGVIAHVGIIDNDYRACICVILLNINSDKYNIEIGDRIGQLTLVKFDQAAFQEVVSINAESVERIGGFGSTG